MLVGVYKYTSTSYVYLVKYVACVNCCCSFSYKQMNLSNEIRFLFISFKDVYSPFKLVLSYLRNILASFVCDQ